MHFALKVLVSILLIGTTLMPVTSFANTAEEIDELSPLNVELEDPDTIEQEPITTKEITPWENVASNNTKNSTAQKFSDIGPDHWAKTEIYHLSELNIINGYQDGEFRATLPIKRGQAANLFTTALELKTIPYEPIFSDISSKSSFATGALATYNANIFKGKEDGTFGAGDRLTREQLATTLVRAFNLKDTGETVTLKDWSKISASHRENVKILAQHGITRGDEKGNYNPKTNVSRATFTIMLYRSLIASNKLTQKNVTITAAPKSNNFKVNNAATNFVQITQQKEPIFIRSASTISFLGSTTKTYDTAKDAIYNYNIDGKNAQFTLTVRTLTNGSQFVFSTLKNNSAKKIQVDVFQTTNNVTSSRLVRFDRHKINRGSPSSESYDLATAPTGVLQLMGKEGHLVDRMIGQAYRSRDLTQTYKSGAQSQMRELYSETENFSHITLNDTFYSFYKIESNGKDIVDSWFVSAEDKLFKSDKSMDAWMAESAKNYRKRNKWYTSQGPYNKMATTTEPMPSSKKGYGRNLLLVKEDRALELFEQQGDLYFETIVLNSFVNLDNFKGNDKFWYTEVTSTYLKSLYGITAPFVDTRFNEQIALFYLRGGKEAGVKNYRTPLKNYADQLVEQVNKGNVIRVNSNAYYLPDYHPVKQKVKTHSSMNHMLGGIAILLHAYEEFGTQSYLNVARAQMNAIAAHKSKWIRSNNDIWYKIDPKQKFIGTDYVHLTLEDLTYVYYLWSNTDTTYLPLLEDLIASKSKYLRTNGKGHTEKIRTNLERIDMLKYLP